MKKILMPLVIAGALVLPAACGSEDAGSTPQPSTPQPSTPAPVVLTQAEFAPKVLAAMQAKGTFHTVSVNADEEATYTTDVKLSAAGTELSGSSDATGEDALSVVRADGQLYIKETVLNKNKAKPWTKYNPKSTDPTAALTTALFVVAEGCVATHDVVGGAAHATGFSSAPAGESTVYSMTIDLQKAAAAKALGNFMPATMATELKGKTLPLKITLGKDQLPTKLEFTYDGSKVVTEISKYGDPVKIAAPAAAEVA